MRLADARRARLASTSGPLPSSLATFSLIFLSWLSAKVLIAAAAIVFWSALPSSPRDRWLNFALGLIFAGAVGNLYDRVVFRGVRDFLHFYPQGVGLDFNFPVFNIADCCLVCGAGVLMLHALLVQPHHEKAPAPEAAEAIAPALTPAPEAEAAVSK